VPHLFHFIAHAFASVQRVAHIACSRCVAPFVAFTIHLYGLPTCRQIKFVNTTPCCGELVSITS